MVNLYEFLGEFGDEFREKGKKFTPLFPYSVKIKITGRCNLNCDFCTYWMSESEDCLTISVMDLLLSRLKEMGTRKVHFSGGEVFLRDDWFEIFSLAKRYGFRINLTSNGTLIDLDVALKVVDVVDSISISIDSPTPVPHDKYRGKGNFKKSVKAVRFLIKARKMRKKKIKIRVNTLITKKNYMALGNMGSFVKSIGAGKLLFIPVDDEEGKFCLSKRRIVDFYREIFPKCREDMIKYKLYDNPFRLYPFGSSKKDLEYASRGEYALGYYEKNLCFAPLLHSFIWWNGDVYPCCMLRGKIEPLGNVLKEDFRDIWNGEKYIEFREKIREKKDLCKNCDDFLYENRILNEFLREKGV